MAHLEQDCEPADIAVLVYECTQLVRAVSGRSNLRRTLSLLPIHAVPFSIDPVDAWSLKFHI